MHIRTIHSHELSEAYALVAGLDQYYPGFDTWWHRKVSVSEGSGQIVLGAFDAAKLFGVALGKRGEHEVKMQCVRVHQDHQGGGLGIQLMDRLLEQLAERHPLCTVSEEMLHQYSRAFVKRYGFSLDSVDKGLYRPGKLEYIFNRS